MTDLSIGPAVAIATCCHHCCTWQTYINRPFIADAFPDVAPETAFNTLTSVAPWATEATVEDRRILGVKAKRILDIGRAPWLRETLACSHVDMVIYTQADLTPENLLLLAW